MKERGVVLVALALACAVATNPVAMASPEEDLDATDVAADAAFIYLLDERRMLDRFFDDEKSAIAAGRAVCDMADRNFPMRVINSVTGGLLDLPADNPGVSIFEALSIRTFCPPSPEDRSYG